MTEYWKSIPRKFCEFCKCWLTDNKPSVDFHEKGKKHQENVKRKIGEVKKKGLEKFQQKKEEDAYMQQMEKAALEAFKNDLKANPELAAQYGVKVKVEGPELPPARQDDDAGQSDKTDEGTKGEDEEPCHWYEAVSDDTGYHYYWNTLTNESVWEKPEKYMSLAEQGLADPDSEDKSEAVAVETDHVSTEKKEQPLNTTEDEQKKDDDENKPLDVYDIPLPGSIPLPEPQVEMPPKPVKPVQDRNARGAYAGKWENVSYEPEQHLDLGLPILPQDYTQHPNITIDEPVRLKIKEKRIESLGKSSGPAEFKKRKLASGARNVRRRDDDD